ncbi:MAG: UvrD-helicase domain-containing protein [Verrucomicrobiales bacterium]|nr:UvrD-helicase domain-containing protein [Verrucomicrobiales bacterium]
MLDLSALNPQQRRAVETLDGPVLILAGAGTGKTRVITWRVAHLIARGVPPENILAVTFTNKAAREMRERVRALLPKLGGRASSATRGARAGSVDGAGQPTICTFHSLCVRILRRHIARLGYKPNFVIYDESDQLGVVRRILAGISSRGEKADPAAVLAMLSRLRNGGQGAAMFGDAHTRALAEHILGRYQAALRACNAVDFDDLLLLTLRLFEAHPDVLEACRAQYRHVMVDEYQDTNAAQFRLLLALARKHRNLCVVGDDDQSIYGWRGAEIANLLDLEKHFPDVRVIKLEQNYRSTNTILAAANALIQHNARRRAKRLWSQKGEGAKIRLQCCENEDAEARAVVERMELARMAERVPWSAHAVLFRTNQQARPLETALRRARIPYRVVGGSSWFDRREVRDVLAWLKVLVNPDDEASLLRIANVPARGLSEATLERLLALSHERGMTVFAAMKMPAVTANFPARTGECIGAFVALVERARAELARGGRGAVGAGAMPSANSLSAWVDGFLERIGYYADLRRWEKDAETAENRVRNLKDLIAGMETVRPPGASWIEGVQQFLEEVSLETDREEEEEPGRDAVTLITMHSCKGLEFRRVHIVGMEEGLLPHARARVEGTLEEERRLFYVAITRAMESVCISHCAARRKFGQLTPCRPSPFLKELPPELVETGDAASSRPVTAEAGRRLFESLRESVR